MSENPSVKTYDSQTADYHDAFRVFLDHTDQKVRAKNWLKRFVEALPARNVFIDSGAGEGTLTAFLLPFFAKTIAIEPNASLRDALRQSCPNAEILGDLILDAQPSGKGDFILCSHVFYYIPAEQWMPTLERLASWLSPQGSLVVLLQNSATDGMKMLQHFFGQRFDIAALGQRFEAQHGNAFVVKVETDPATIRSNEFSTACTIAEFMLNLLPMPNPPPRHDLEKYVQANFYRPDEKQYRFSCNQDFLQIRRK